jgi:N-methylhydantoinase A/oxoprolinase/acetone carboxylase beta subunit
VHTLFSGPAASVQGGVFLSGEAEAVVVDVGGTTTDIGRVRGGRAPLKAGGILINGRQIAVDGLDIATFGLAGDSRLRRLGETRYRFVNERALPFCRARESYPSLSLRAVEAELADRWHFGDPELIELVALDALRVNRADVEALGPGQRWLVERLRSGPRRVRALSDEHAGGSAGAAAGPGDPPLGDALHDLIRRRLAVHIALTPTDVYCARGQAPGFSADDAKAAVALYARMADREPGEFLAALHEVVRSQATGVLAGTLGGFDPPLEPEGAVMERLVALLLASPAGTEPLLALDPRCAVVLAGAGAPVLYADAPESLRRRIVSPADGDVANALGAITTRFLLRESVTIEPLRQGGVELFDHHSKRHFSSLALALAYARAALEAKLQGRAAELKLTDTRLDVQVEIVEDYAEFSRRARKELVIARVAATLTGMPE